MSQDQVRLRLAVADVVDGLLLQLTSPSAGRLFDGHKLGPLAPDDIAVTRLGPASGYWNIEVKTEDDRTFNFNVVIRGTQGDM